MLYSFIYLKEFSLLNILNMVFEGEHAVKLHAKDVEDGISAIGNPRHDLVTMGRVHINGLYNN